MDLLWIFTIEVVVVVIIIIVIFVNFYSKEKRVLFMARQNFA